MRATFGVVGATVIIAFISKWVLALLGIDLPMVYCLLFGALISPPDPIAVLGILNKVGVSESLETKICGESLFNDGVAVVIFPGLVTLLGARTGHVDGHAEFGALQMTLFFLREAGGGAILGWICGYLAYRSMLSIDDYKVEVIIT